MNENLTEQTKRRLSKLDALEAGGVEDWEWYDESLKDWFADNEIEEELDNFIDEINDILADAIISEPAGAGTGHAIEFNEKSMRSLAITFAKKFYDIKIEN